MIKWLHEQEPSLLPKHCHGQLDRLRDRYRNAIAHGRAYGEAGRPDASISEAENVFRDCWSAGPPLGCRNTETTSAYLSHQDHRSSKV